MRPDSPGEGISEALRALAVSRGDFALGRLAERAEILLATGGAEVVVPEDVDAAGAATWLEGRTDFVVEVALTRDAALLPLSVLVFRRRSPGRRRGR